MNKCKILVILISYLMMIASLFAFNGGVAAFEKISLSLSSFWVGGVVMFIYYKGDNNEGNL